MNIEHQEEKTNIAEQTQQSTELTVTQDNLGKFKSTEQLLKAYQDLEKEYTRKSQQLSKLNSSTQAVENTEKFKGNELLQNEEFMQNYIYSNEQVVGAIVKDYLCKVNGVSAPRVISNNGSISLIPPIKPKTIAEASTLATLMFRK